MATLCEHINTHVDGLQAVHLPHGSTFKLVGLAMRDGVFVHDADRSGEREPGLFEYGTRSRGAEPMRGRVPRSETIPGRLW